MGLLLSFCLCICLYSSLLWTCPCASAHKIHKAPRDPHTKLAYLSLSSLSLSFLFAAQNMEYHWDKKPQSPTHRSPRLPQQSLTGLALEQYDVPYRYDSTGLSATQVPPQQISVQTVGTGPSLTAVAGNGGPGLVEDAIYDGSTATTSANTVVFQSPASSASSSSRQFQHGSAEQFQPPHHDPHHLSREQPNYCWRHHQYTTFEQEDEETIKQIGEEEAEQQSQLRSALSSLSTHDSSAVLDDYHLDDGLAHDEGWQGSRKVSSILNVSLNSVL